MLGTATRLQNARTISLSGAVSGSASFNGSGNVTITTTQANIAVLTGTLVHDGVTQDTDISYPSGFNNTNSVVISSEGQYGRNYVNHSYGSTFDSVSYVRGGVQLNVSLLSNKIIIRASNVMLTETGDGLTGINRAITVDMKYRIVLLKIN